MSLLVGRANSGPTIPQIPLGPLSIGQAIAIESVLGAPAPARIDSPEREGGGGSGASIDVDSGGGSESGSGSDSGSLSTCNPKP